MLNEMHHIKLISVVKQSCSSTSNSLTTNCNLEPTSFVPVDTDSASHCEESMVDKLP